MCSTVNSSERTSKVYIQKEVVLLGTSITESHEMFYILAIQKLAFLLPHVRILGTHHCDKEHRDAFKRRYHLYDVLCHCAYEEQLVYSFSHQTKS